MLVVKTKNIYEHKQNAHNDGNRAQPVPLYNISGEASALLYGEEQSFKKPF